MLNILVCDDEEHWISANQNYIQKLSDRYKIKIKIRSFSQSLLIPDDVLVSTDIAFLDIDLREKESDGLLLAERIVSLNKWAVIIFVTCHNQYTLHAFKIQAFGYLMKPINKIEFNSLFVKAILQANTASAHRIDAVLEFYYERVPVQIKQRDIIYIERKDRKVEINTFRKKYLVNMSIREIVKKLESSFILVNQSVIVNLDEIRDFEKDVITLKTGNQFFISKNYFKAAKEKYFVFMNQGS